MSWTHLRTSQPCARKKYACYLCSYSIGIGEKYVKTVGVYDGALVSDANHIRCMSFTKDWTQDDWECTGQGDLREEVKRRIVSEK